MGVSLTVRALFVAPYLPTPGSGGRTRLLNLMSRLSQRHDVSLVAFTSAEQQAHENPYPGIVLAPPPKRARPGGPTGAAVFYREKLQRLPAFVSWMDSPEMHAAVRDAVERFHPDVVQVETTEMGQYLGDIPAGPARVLDLQDVASRWFGRVRRHGDTRKQRALMGLEFLKTRAYETRCARIPEAVLVSSAMDGVFLRGLTGVDAVEVPNGVDVASFSPMPEVAEEPGVILFVGPMTYDANLDGMRWFAREVLPLVRREEPGARLDLVGTAATESFGDGVRVLGRVEDVRPHLARAPVSIVPVRVGTGTRYKILEALSMSRAVVSTTVGAEGLGLADDEHLLLGDEPEEFARAVVTLLRDPARRARLGSAGRAHIAARYDWGSIVGRVEEVWDRVASTK
ncbi:MAG: glycosyltransferase [Actinomycetota bacterium]